MKKYHVLGDIPGEPFPVKEGNKYRYINYRGEQVTPAVYDEAYPFNDGLAAVSLFGKYGYINIKDKPIISFQYLNAGKYAEGYAPVMNTSGWGYINKKGQTLIEFIYQDAHEFSEGLASVKSDGKYHFINGDGSVALPGRYSWAGSFKSGIALVEMDNGYAFIDGGGKVLLEGIDYNLVKEYRDTYPYSVTNLLELYEGIKNRKKIPVNPESIILIQEARLRKGRAAELANLLEVILQQKNDFIYNKHYEEAARLRRVEVALLTDIKRFLER